MGKKAYFYSKAGLHSSRYIAEKPLDWNSFIL